MGNEGKKMWEGRMSVKNVERMREGGYKIEEEIMRRWKKWKNKQHWNKEV